jgi:hypothetical protein
MSDSPSDPPPPGPPRPIPNLAWELVDNTAINVVEQRARSGAAFLNAGSVPLETIETTVGVPAEFGATVDASARQDGVGNVDANAIISPGAPFWMEQLLGIAGDLRSFVPVVRQSVEAQTKLTGNVATLVARLTPDAARIVELIADNLEKEARSGHPDVQVVEQCLRVGAWLMRQVLTVIVGVGCTIAGEYLLHPDETAERIQAVVTSTEHIVAKLF